MMLQIYKMEMKFRAGARFFVTQLGFGAMKLRNLRAYLMEKNMTVPVLGSVFILRKGAAAMMNRGEVPGSFVDDRLFQLVSKEAESGDKGSASLERAAMQVAVLKGLGFKGAHIEAMVLTFPMVETILGRAAELRPDWEECAEKLVRRNGGLQETTWNEALKTVVEGLNRIKQSYSADSIGVLSSAKCTNEENFLVMKLASAVIGTNHLTTVRVCATHRRLPGSAGSTSWWSSTGIRKKIFGHSLSLTSKIGDWLNALDDGLNSEFPDGVRGQSLKLVSDNGSQPTSQRFMQVYTRLTIEHILTSYNNPKGNARPSE